MSYFNGEHVSGRVVNLGASNSQLSKSSVLQKAQIQREKRKLLKQRENAAKTLQKHIRSHLILFSIKKYECEQLTKDLEDFSELQESYDINQIIYRFTFTQRYALKNLSDSENHARFKQLYQILQNNLQNLNKYIFKLLFQSIGDSFEFYGSASSEFQILFDIVQLMSHYESSEIKFDVCRVLLNFCPLPDNINTKDVQDVEISLRLPKDNDALWDLVGELQKFDPKTCALYILNPLKLFFEGEELTKAQTKAVISIANNVDFWVSFSDSMQNELAVLVLNLCRIAETGTDLTTLLISLVQNIDCSLVTDEEYDDDVSMAYSDDDESEDYYENDSTDKKIIFSAPDCSTFVVPPELLKPLHYLYSPKFMDKALVLFNSGVISEEALGKFWTSLLKLRPDFSGEISNLFIYIQTIPEWVSKFSRLIFNEFDESDSNRLAQNKRYFNWIVGMDEKDVIRTDNILFLSVFDVASASEFKKTSNFQFFFQDLLIFLKFFNFWLFISTDHEVVYDADTKFLNRQQIEQVSTFLKHVCLLLCWNSVSLDKRFNELKAELSFLEKTCINCLTQINLLDSRVHILPKDFWNVDDAKLKQTNVFLGVIENEEVVRYTNNINYGNSKHEQLSEGILKLYHKLPFLINFENRVLIFNMLKDLDKRFGNYSSQDGFETSQRTPVNVRRDHVLEDGFEALKTIGDFTKLFSIAFIDNYGNAEPGIDGGGLTKEFLTAMVAEGIKNPKSRMFKSNQEAQLYPNPDIYLNLYFNDSVRKSPEIRKYEMQKLKSFYYLGLVIGKCLYDGILADVDFAPFFLQKWKSVSKRSKFDELIDIEKELYQGLNKFVKLDDDFFKDADITFNIEEKVTYTIPEKCEIDVDTGETIIELERNMSKILSIELIRNGNETLVTNLNKSQYINAIANFKLNKCLNLQTKNFLDGLSRVVSLRWLSMFNPAELQMLISGKEKFIDIEDLKANTEYLGKYHATHITIKLLWECLEEMNYEQRSNFVKFVTSASRAPLLGFGALKPKFAIRDSGDPGRLPSASTCVNLLKLPDYRDKKLMMEKLLRAINSNSGFELS